MTARPARRRAPPPSPAKTFSLHGAPEISASERRFWTILTGCVSAALAAALLAMVFGPHRIGDYFTETDFYGAYAQGARLIEHGRLIPSRYGVIGPGYEIALALVGFVIRDLFLAAELISVVAAVTTVILWFHLLERRAGARLAALAVLFIATNAQFFRYGYSAATDTFAIALQALALVLLLTRERIRAVALGGVVAGIAFLTRYNAIYLLPLGLIALLLGGGRVVARGRAASLFAAGFLTPVVPWVIYSLTHGSGFSFQLHHNIAYEVYAHAKGIAWDDYQKNLQPQFKNLWDVIARDPGAVARRMIFNLGDHLRLDAAQLLGWPVAVCGVLGLAIGGRDGSLRRLWPLWLAGLLLFGSLVPVFYSERYSLALLPLYTALAAIPFASPLGASVLSLAGRRVPLKPLLAALPLAAAIAVSVKLQARVIDQLPVEVLECAKTLREKKAPGDRVIARKWHVAYHGDVDGIAFPFTNSLAELADYAHANRARWLYFSWPEAETRPQYSYLLDTTGVIPGLKAWTVTRPHPAVLYEIGPQFGVEPAWLGNDTLRAYHIGYARLMIDSSDPDLLYRFAQIAWTVGRVAEARQALERAVQYRPRDPNVLILLGNVLLRMRQPGPASTVFERAEAVQPGSVEARVGRGYAILMLGRLQDAATLWRPVISATRNPLMLERMVSLYASLGDRQAEAEARAVLERVRGQS